MSCILNFFPRQPVQRINTLLSPTSLCHRIFLTLSCLIPSPWMDSAAWSVEQNNLTMLSMKKASFRSVQNVSCFPLCFPRWTKDRELFGSKEIYFCLPISLPTVFPSCSGRLKVSHSTVTDYHCVSSNPEKPQVLIPLKWLDKARLTSHSCNTQCNIQRLKRYTEHEHCPNQWTKVFHLTLGWKFVG